MIRSTKEEYHEAKGQTAERLAEYSLCPDLVYRVHEDERFFSEETAIKTMLQDYCEGTSFFDKYFVVSDKITGDINPDLLDYIEWGRVEEFRNMYINDVPWTKRYIQTVKRWARISYDSGGKCPVPLDTSNVYKKIITNILNIEMFGDKLKRFFRDSSWYQFLSWNISGDFLYYKKALVDMASIIDVYGNEQAVFFDISIQDDLGMFENEIKEKLWVKSCHYIEGGSHQTDRMYPSVIFIAIQMKEPYLVRSYEVSDDIVNKCQDRYKELSESYAKWDLNKNPYIGFLRHQKVTPSFLIND